MTILSESTQYTLTGSGRLFAALAFIAFCIAINLFFEAYYKTGLAFLAIVISFIVIVYVFGVEPHRKIKVILADDYPAVELLDKYTVDGREGEMWVLTEKKPMREGDE